MTDDIYYLTRFRADPKKIRIAVRPVGDEWRVAIYIRDVSVPYITARGKSPLKTLVRALREAENNHFPGIDLNMSWAYEHPQGELGRDVTKHSRSNPSKVYSS